MISDRQFLRLFARLIIKELVKAAIRKVIEHIMEERLIYDEWTGQPTRVHMVGLLNDGCVVAVEGPKEHVREGGGYSQYSREIPKRIWDKLTPADPTRTQLVDRVKSALQPLGLEVTAVDDHDPYNCVIITANGFFSRGENDETKFDNESNFGGRPVRDNPEAAIQPKDYGDHLPIDSRGLHLPDAQSIRDGAIGKVGDTEMRTGGLVNPVLSYMNTEIPIGGPVGLGIVVAGNEEHLEIKGRAFTDDFKKGSVIEAFGKTFLVTDVGPDHMDMTNVATFEVTRTTGLTYDEKGSIAGMSGSVVVPQADNMSPAAVRQRLADFQGCALSQIVAFMDVQIDGTDVRDFCFCCGDDDGHELGGPGACVSRTEELTDGSDAKPFSRAEAQQLAYEWCDAPWDVKTVGDSPVGCSCANPECTWRNSLNCRYDAYSDLEERGAIE